MKCYIVTFDAADVAVRKNVRERLKTYGLWCPMHKHCWAIMSDQNAVQIRDHLTELLGPDDRLFVVRSGTEAAWQHSYGPKNNEWLKKYL